MHPDHAPILPPSPRERPAKRQPPRSARVLIVRDGPVPNASCPHCSGPLDLSLSGISWRVRRPSDIADRLAMQLADLEREELHVMLLDARNTVIGQDKIYQGNVLGSVVRIGELFQSAVSRHAASVILCHNHPSGDPTPSAADIALTTEAIQAGTLLSIPLLDHVIVGRGRFISLREWGVRFPRDSERPESRESRGRWWRDHRYGAYKSALQKYIRRAETDKAVAAAAQLARLPGGTAMLGRRLPVVAAEDVGWALIPAAGRRPGEGGCHRRGDRRGPRMDHPMRRGSICARRHRRPGAPGRDTGRARVTVHYVFRPHRRLPVAAYTRRAPSPFAQPCMRSAH